MGAFAGEGAPSVKPRREADGPVRRLILVQIAPESRPASRSRAGEPPVRGPSGCGFLPPRPRSQAPARATGVEHARAWGWFCSGLPAQNQRQPPNQQFTHNTLHYEGIWWCEQAPQFERDGAAALTTQGVLWIPSATLKKRRTTSATEGH